MITNIKVVGGRKPSDRGVFIDGREMENVRSVDIHVDPTSIPSVKLEMFSEDTTVFEGEADVTINVHVPLGYYYEEIRIGEIRRCVVKKMEIPNDHQA